MSTIFPTESDAAGNMDVFSENEVGQSDDM